ncbi:hypothetical protein P691DRAFT_803533 [Macrolepiota fuliginosa MF-IS2]|uniref:Asp/Glu/hydantoin racemase n=1 Tax=Macrolepiota fuliginosa MF-IS2 TaxID=1400762 RepID=A0A9P6C0M8_9AGAR|nr:hypothetical protein P691DRAFT_803533 [Macrolepiota fuliginosa MF-IS2]
MPLEKDSIASLLIINPNSSGSITEGLVRVLTPLTPPGAALTFYTAPNCAPPAIENLTTGVQSAHVCYEDILNQDLLNHHDGFLVCCFSDHPLTYMLRERTSKPVIGILESAIVQAMLIGKRFGIVTTGTGYKYEHYTEVRNFLGANSERFAGLVAVGLGVVELREGDKTHVEKKMKEGAMKIAEKGADVVLLGCAGMAGMEGLVKDGFVEAGYGVPKVVDGAKSGIVLLAGLVRIPA